MFSHGRLKETVVRDQILEKLVKDSVISFGLPNGPWRRLSMVQYRSSRFGITVFRLRGYLDSVLSSKERRYCIEVEHDWECWYLSPYCHNLLDNNSGLLQQ